MEILLSKQHHEFLAFLPEIKFSVEEWQFVTLKMEDPSQNEFTIQKAAELVQTLYQNKTGKIYICNNHELIMLLRDNATNPALMTQEIETVLPTGYCEIQIEKPTAENLSRFKIKIKFDDLKLSEAALKRRGRTENVVLVADDDMYMRTLVKKGLPPRYTVQEAIHGSEIMTAYKKYAPDILFLDIHMPGKDGMENLESVLAYDPQAFIIMLSSDSSSDNVIKATKHGAKGFMAKPFTKDTLQNIVKKCPTLI